MNGSPQGRGPKFRTASLLTAAAILIAACSGASTTPGAATPAASTAASVAPSAAPASEAPIGPSQAEIDAALGTPTTLTYWGWDLSAPASVEAFQKLHPAITINYENVGVGPASYQKVRTALAGGSGIPDIIFLEGAAVPSFAMTDSLLDLTTMGAASLKDLFIPAAWTPGVLGDQVFGLPVGANATASYYREDLFEQAGITTPPATWEEFAAAAKLLKEKTGATIADFSPNDIGMMLNNVYQAGITPFSWTPGSTDVEIHLNSPEIKELMAYWTGLIADGYVSTGPAWVDSYWQAFDAGKIATWQAGVWGSPVLAGTTKTAGKWRLAPWPQWTPGGTAGAVWQGGITDVVMKASPNPIVAYEFLKFRATDPAFATDKYTKWGWDPVLKSVIADPAWIALKDEFLGGQAANEVWADELANGGTSWSWLPFSEYIAAAYSDTVGKAAVDQTDMDAALDAWQQKVVDYATQQGFTVK